MSECKYCNADYYVPLNKDTIIYSNIEIALCCKSETIRARKLVGETRFETQDLTRINYCPMCGRKLGD